MTTQMEVNTGGRARKRLTLKDKKKSCDCIRRSEVMRIFNIKSKTTVRRLDKKRELFLSAPEDDKAPKKIFTIRKFEEVEKALLKFVEDCHARDMPLSRNDLKQEALDIAQRLQIKGFTGSNGWVHKFMKRYDLGSVVLHGEEASASQDVADSWISNDIPTIIQSYKNEDIFNCDETGTQYRALPKKTLTKEGQKKKGGKVNKERLAAGKKLPPLIIGNSKKPRIFTKAKLDIQKAGFSWYANSTAWMKTGIFEEWLTNLNNSMKAQKRKILLLLDNFSAHRVDSKSNVRLVFLPPNLTSKVQPLDKGIIASYKKYEQRFKAEHRRKSLYNFSSASDYTKSINVLDAVKWVVRGWAEVKESTIRNCFRAAGVYHMTERS
ncbi:hypothetical protein RvY_06810 [Ramazzottius varieornatus]|uniref:HTH CENPB-type domain-containing protein n=1 Tax=Ramazzottius varieornatus TaxID=947166 RepID=A0A1D1V366_RAMVA|nr:hypothetical protein RvY_06810 [Ramazzottius varieornatus]